MGEIESEIERLRQEDERGRNAPSAAKQAQFMRRRREAGMTNKQALAAWQWRVDRYEANLRMIAERNVRNRHSNVASDTGYKGRNAKLSVLAARITDDELQEVEAAVLKLSKRARERGGTPYVRSDLVRGAVLDFARWVNDSKSPAKLDEAIEVLEDALT